MVLGSQNTIRNVFKRKLYAVIGVTLTANEAFPQRLNMGARSHMYISYRRRPQKIGAAEMVVATADLAAATANSAVSTADSAIATAVSAVATTISATLIFRGLRRYGLEPQGAIAALHNAPLLAHQNRGSSECPAMYFRVEANDGNNTGI